MSEPLIEVRHLAKAFRIPSRRRDTVREHALDLFRPRPSETLQVLRDVNFDLRPGETMGLMGRNGSGKSTLLKILSGIYAPDAGTIRRRVAITPILELGVGWNPDLDAVDNIFLLGGVMGLGLRELHAAVDDILVFAGVERFANLELRHYSSGMASRLAYAVAFRAVRDVLILDEVFAVGDAEFRERCHARYRELRRAGHSVILVSHEPRTIVTFCDRALLLEEGVISFEGTAEAAADRYLSLLTAERPALASA